MYYLVTLAEPDKDGSAAIDHEGFIDSLIARHLILLGGPVGDEPWPDASAAYVLRCDSRQEADDLVRADPLVAAGLATATVAPWSLVGIDPRVIDPALVVNE